MPRDPRRERLEKGVETRDVPSERRRELEQQRPELRTEPRRHVEELRTSSPQSRSRASCVIRFGAFSVTRKSPGVARSHPSIAFAVGMR
jgi:hypothetical protein